MKSPVKILSLIMAVIMTLLIVSSCGNNNPPIDNPEVPEGLTDLEKAIYIANYAQKAISNSDNNMSYTESMNCSGEISGTKSNLDLNISNKRYGLTTNDGSFEYLYGFTSDTDESSYSIIYLNDKLYVNLGSYIYSGNKEESAKSYYDTSCISMMTIIDDFADFNKISYKIKNGDYVISYSKPNDDLLMALETTLWSYVSEYYGYCELSEVIGTITCGENMIAKSNEITFKYTESSTESAKLTITFKFNLNSYNEEIKLSTPANAKDYVEVDDVCTVLTIQNNMYSIISAENGWLICDLKLKVGDEFEQLDKSKFKFGYNDDGVYEFQQRADIVSDGTQSDLEDYFYDGKDFYYGTKDNHTEILYSDISEEQARNLIYTYASNMFFDLSYLTAYETEKADEGTKYTMTMENTAYLTYIKDMLYSVGFDTENATGYKVTGSFYLIVNDDMEIVRTNLNIKCSAKLEGTDYDIDYHSYMRFGFNPDEMPSN